jgi:hypothetical protein
MHIRKKLFLQNARVKRSFYLLLKCQFETKKQAPLFFLLDYICHIDD